jgi:transposase-like protein
MSILSAKYFHDEAAAFRHLEKVTWADGVTCPHCGVIGRANKLEGVKDKKGRVRLGLWKCYECRKQFTVRVGTVFESAHIPLHKMLQAVYLMCASKKGVSAHQLHRTLEITYKSAWFLAHRIREAMRPKVLTPMGGEGKVVEIDETVFGKLEGAPKHKFPGYGQQWRNTVLALVERGGSARMFHVDGTTVGTLIPVIRTNVRRESIVMTDELRTYQRLGQDYAAHETVNHGADEYVRGTVTTNTVEGYFSIFKRGMKGVYQHCAEKHLHRYLSEFDFRYNSRIALGYDDETRTNKALAGIVGKRLTYRNPDEARSV